VHGYVAQGIPLNTYGVGMGNFNDALLEQLADHGNGSYAYIDTLDEARSLFVEKLTSSLDTIALNAKIQIDFNPDVVATYRLIGYEDRAIADQNFRNDAVSAGALGPGHHATAIYAVTFRPGAQGRIATAQLRWEDPQTHAVQEINGNLNTWDLAGSFEAAAPRFQLLATVAEYAELLRQSPWAGRVSLSTLAGCAQRLVQLLLEDADVIEFASLVSAAARLSGSYE
jgi:Ca-activated chloride channel family protein